MFVARQCLCYVADPPRLTEILPARQHCLTRRARCLAAYHNDVVIGAIACRLERQPDATAKLYIMTIGVLAPYRGYGVGELLQRKLHRIWTPTAQSDPTLLSAKCPFHRLYAGSHLLTLIRN